jgi:hypothetical protein
LGTKKNMYNPFSRKLFIIRPLQRDEWPSTIRRCGLSIVIYTVTTGIIRLPYDCNAKHICFTCWETGHQRFRARKSQWEKLPHHRTLLLHRKCSLQDRPTSTSSHRLQVTFILNLEEIFSKGKMERFGPSTAKARLKFRFAIFFYSQKFSSGTNMTFVRTQNESPIWKAKALWSTSLGLGIQMRIIVHTPLRVGEGWLWKCLLFAVEHGVARRNLFGVTSFIFCKLLIP